MIPEALWDQAAGVLRGAEEVVVACHVNPDGDALGSMLGLGSFLERLGLKVWVSWGTEPPRVPPQYGFLPGIGGISHPGDLPDRPEVFVAIDCADKARLEVLAPRFDEAASTVVIDHHLSNHGFGAINLIDPAAASSCELAYELIKRMGGVPGLGEATCLYTGIVTDTGRFQHSSATPSTLRAAADLRDLGVDHEMVAAEVYESSSFRYLHVLGVVLARARFEDGLVWSWLRQEDLGDLAMDETEHLIDVLRAVRGSTVAAILKEVGAGTYKVSLRSRGTVDVSSIALGFGGGGHARAAGFSASGSVEEVIGAIRSRLPAA